MDIFLLCRKDNCTTPERQQSSVHLFGEPLDHLCYDNRLPDPVMNMLRRLHREGPFTMGIFRKSANARIAREVKAMLDKDTNLALDEYPIHVIANLFKEFLREIPGGLLVERYRPRWLAASKDCSIISIHNIYLNLPLRNQLLLRYFICLLATIHNYSEENMMNASNLAVCVAPSLFYSKHSNQIEAVQLSNLITFMIEKSEQIFGDDILGMLGPVLPLESLCSINEEHETSTSSQEMEATNAKDDDDEAIITTLLVDSAQRKSDTSTTSEQYYSANSSPTINSPTGHRQMKYIKNRRLVRQTPIQAKYKKTRPKVKLRMEEMFLTDDEVTTPEPKTPPSRFTFQGMDLEELEPSTSINEELLSNDVFYRNRSLRKSKRRSMSLNSPTKK